MSVDLISDQFPHVSTYNYAENSPIANIDLHGLQKYFASDGEFIKQQGKDNSIRVVQATKKGRIGINYKNLDSKTLNSISQPAQVATKENKKTSLRNWAKIYKAKGSKYAENREFAMSLYTAEMTDEDGSTFDVFIEGETMKGNKGQRNISLSDSEAPFEEFELSTTIHTHPSGNPGDFSDDPGLGGKYFTGDIQYAQEYNVILYLAVPKSDWIGSFNPAIFNDKSKTQSDDLSKMQATDDTAIKIY